MLSNVSAEEFLDGKIVLHAGDCLQVLKGLQANSVDAVVTDPPYGLEFMGKGWDGSDGFRRSLNEADVGRNNVFARTSKRAPEYKTGGAGQKGKPGLGERPTEWVNNQRWNQFRCAECGHLFHGGSPCECETPQPVRADNRWHLFQAWCEAWASEVYRVLKPGGHMVAFGGSRTYHRMACGVEDAGFEIRDKMEWAYGQGFPKSLNVAIEFEKKLCERWLVGSRKEWFYIGEDERMRREAPFRDPDANEWAGWGTALKPASEPICIARRPLQGTVAENVKRWGVGALNIDECRINNPDAEIGGREGEETADRRYTDKGSTNFAATPGPRGGDAKGRWPSNIMHDGSDAVIEAFPDAPGQQQALVGGEASKSQIYGKYGPKLAHTPRNDFGSAARFFYSAKADKDDRLGSGHPTVKPVDLIQYLVRLVTPRNGLVLDLFAGSGTTGEAAFREGMRAVLIEREEEYQEDIRERISLLMASRRERRIQSVRVKSADLGPLFSGAA